MDNLPKVLVVGINPWIDNTGINTLINLFSCWEKQNLFHIYTTDALPNTCICDNFFQIAESNVLKSILKRKTVTGKVVANTNVQTEDVRSIKRRHGILLTWARECVWKLGKWRTKALDEYISKCNADVLFMPLYSSIYMNRIQNYIAKKTGKPVVIYASDDNYTYKSCSKNPLALLHRALLRTQIGKLVKRSKEFIVIAPKQKQEYDRIFNIDCKIITKGIDFRTLKFYPYTPSKPIKMVYTGKLIIGRDFSLIKIADALGKINENSVKITLDIYTPDVLASKQNRLLNRNGVAVKGKVSQRQVEEIQKKSDILVFVEGIDKRYKNKARLSFSTKITDYLKSGKCIFAIGDRDIAPIEYFLSNDAAIVATTENEIYEKLMLISNNESLIKEYGEKAFDCGVRNHEKQAMDALLIDCIIGAMGKNDRND